MEILNKEFWEKRDAAMKRFMASKERKRKRMAELEQMPRQPYSIAVLSTGGRFSSSSLRGEDRDERWSLP